MTSHRAGKPKPHWGRFAPKDFTVTYEGVPAGFGGDPVWSAVPGAWNMLNLLLDLGPIRELGSTPGSFPQSLLVAPLVVGTALQLYDSSTTLGGLTLLTCPSNWLARVRDHTGLKEFIFPALFPATFMEMAEAGVRRLAGNKIVRPNFGG